MAGCACAFAAYGCSTREGLSARLPCSCVSGGAHAYVRYIRTRYTRAVEILRM